MNIMNDSLSKRAKLELSKGVIYVGKHLNVSDFFFLTKIYSLGEVLTLFVKMIR
jgi:hypothetical protein